MRRSMFLPAGLALALPALVPAQFKNVPPKTEEAKQFHSVKVTPTPASARMAAYDQRLRMEGDSFYSQILWRNVGPEYQSGRVVEIATPEDKPGSLHVAYATGGLWRTEDYGNSWTPLFDNQSAFSIGHFTVSRDGQTIWVGSGECNNQRTSYAGTGVFRSKDAGKTWQNMGLAEVHRIGRVAVNPKNPKQVFVAAVGGLYSEDTNRGVYRTNDEGAHWEQVLKIDDTTGAIDVAVSPQDPKVIVAAAYDRDRRAWNYREGGPGTALYRSTDGGSTWAKVTGGFAPYGNLGRIGLSYCASKPNVMYAVIDNQDGDPDIRYSDEYRRTGVLTAYRFLDLTEATFVEVPKDVLERFFREYMPSTAKVDEVVQAVKDKKMTLADIRAQMDKKNPSLFQLQEANTQIYRSDDFGKTWRKAFRGYFGDQLGYYCSRVFVDPKDADHLMIAGLNMFESTDGGRRFKPVSGRMHSDFHAFWFDPRDSRIQAAGNDGGCYLSMDGGTTWRHLNSLAVGQFTTIAVDNQTPYNIFGGLQDNGTQMGPSNYRMGFSPLSQWKSISGGDGSAVAVDPRPESPIAYTASQFGAHGAQNLKTGDRWNARPPGAGLRFNWVSPFIISPHNPDVVYCGSNKLHRSMNQGRKWETLSEDLTKNLPNGDVPFSTLTSISESPFKFGVLYVGADDGSVKMTQNHGVAWIDISTPAKDRWVTRIVASKWDAGTVYCSQNGYRQDDWTPYLWKSTDYGKTWTSIAGDLPMECINVVREDPKNEGWLYVGTDMGVFVSMNGGKNWIPLSGGIPHTPVHDIAIQERESELVIGTHARSVWVFPLSELYSLTSDITSKEFHLWPVDNMSRTDWEYRRRPDTDYRDAPAPTISGRLWTRSGGKGVVRLVDASGAVVTQKEITWTKGLNPFSLSLQLEEGKRFTVDAHNRPIKTAADVLKDPYEAERPKYVAAGEYSLEFVIGDKIEKTKWKLN